MEIGPTGENGASVTRLAEEVRDQEQGAVTILSPVVVVLLAKEMITNFAVVMNKHVNQVNNIFLNFNAITTLIPLCNYYIITQYLIMVLTLFHKQLVVPMNSTTLSLIVNRPVRVSPPMSMTALRPLSMTAVLVHLVSTD